MGCTTYPSDLAAFDGLVGFEADQARESAGFEVRDTTVRPPSWWFLSMDGVTELLGFDREVVSVPFPRAALRDVLRRLPTETGKHLDRMADVLWRALLVADEDAAGIDRATALREALAVGRALPGAVPWTVEAWPAGREDRRLLEERLRDVLEGLVDLWPGDEVARRDQAARARYVDLLTRLARIRIVDPALGRGRIRLFVEALTYENDAEVQRDVARLLIACCKQALIDSARRHCRDDAPIVRITAIDVLWTLGSMQENERVLDELTNACVERTRGRPGSRVWIDESDDVRRHVVHLVESDFDRLPRDEMGALTDSKLLRYVVETALRDPVAGLRLASRDALSALTGRPRDPDAPWLASWWQELVTGADKARGE